MPLDTRLQDSPLGLNPQACFEDKAARSFHPGIPLPELGKLYAAELQSRCLRPTPPPFQSLLYSHDKESCGKQFSRSNIQSWCAAAAATTTTRPPQNGGLESSQKRLLIFDQSGNETRLLRCPFLPLRFPSPTAAEPVKLSGLEKTFREEDCVTSKEYDNDLESEMHEDTEEINALLYSDDDYDDDCESDDEVMSTGHSPEQDQKRQLEEEEEEEIDGPHRKKQKLLDNISDSSSLVGTKLNGSSFLKDNNLLESNISSKEDDTGSGSGSGSGLSNEQSRKDKIRTALKILESVIPGANAKGNEALLLLDEAIDYLKLLKRDLISTVTSHQSC